MWQWMTSYVAMLARQADLRGLVLSRYIHPVAHSYICNHTTYIVIHTYIHFWYILASRLLELLTLQFGSIDDHKVFALAKFLATIAVNEDRFELDSR